MLVNSSSSLLNKSKDLLPSPNMVKVLVPSMDLRALNFLDIRALTSLGQWLNKANASVFVKRKLEVKIFAMSALAKFDRWKVTPC